MYDYSRVEELTDGLVSYLAGQSFVLTVCLGPKTSSSRPVMGTMT